VVLIDKFNDMRLKTILWAKALLAAFIGGVANAGLSALGISGAQAVGVQIPQLDWKQFVTVCASGGVIGAFLYLKQSPVPPDPTDTEFLDKPKIGETKP
jgi:hypothetical protein